MASSRMTGSPGYEWVQDYEATYEQAAKYAYEVLYGQGVYGLDPDLARVYNVRHQADGMENILITSMSREGKEQEGNFSQFPKMFSMGLPTVYLHGSLN